MYQITHISVVVSIIWLIPVFLGHSVSFRAMQLLSNVLLLPLRANILNLPAAITHLKAIALGPREFAGLKGKLSSDYYSERKD